MKSIDENGFDATLIFCLSRSDSVGISVECLLLIAGPCLCGNSGPPAARITRRLNLTAWGTWSTYPLVKVGRKPEQLFQIVY